ncbi:MAG: hypothetical protein AAFZ17_20910 [Cyanobacteria bacterium J06650_10]
MPHTIDLLPHVPHVNQSTQHNDVQALISRNICLVVGLACLIGFLVDVLVIGLPPNLFSLEWRVNFCQQLGDRSILFLAGVALLLYSLFLERELTKKLARVCLILGVVYILSSVVVIHDVITLREQTFRELAVQKQELQSTIKASQEAGQLPDNITERDAQQASKSISDRAEVIRRDAGRDIIKVGVASIGNLFAVGLGLIGLSRIGLKRLSKYY